MLHASLAGFILAFIYKFLDKKHLRMDEYHVEIDWWMAFALVFVSSVTIWGGGIAIAILDLPAAFLFVSYIFYIIIPFLIIKFGLEYTSKKAMKYSIWVPIIVIVAEVPFVLIQSLSST